MFTVTSGSIFSSKTELLEGKDLPAQCPYMLSRSVSVICPLALALPGMSVFAFLSLHSPRLYTCGLHVSRAVGYPVCSVTLLARSKHPDICITVNAISELTVLWTVHTSEQALTPSG